jgi:hypothetical protein
VTFTFADGRPWGSHGPPLPSPEVLAGGPHAGLDGGQLNQAAIVCGRWACKVISMFTQAHKDQAIEAHAFACRHRAEIRVAFWQGRKAVDVLAELDGEWAGINYLKEST